MSDIQALFDLDPLKLTDQDIDKIIAYLRERRQEFMTALKTPKGKKPKAEPSSGPIDLGELDL